MNEMQDGAWESSSEHGQSGSVHVVCDCGCGQEFFRSKRRIANSNGPKFLSVEHYGRHRSNTYLNEMCGPFLELAEEYLNGTATLRYKNVRKIHSILGPFFLYLTENSFTSLEEVKPKTITQYLEWSHEVGYKNAAHDISAISVFFSWAITHGHRRGGNPVIPKMHRERKKHRLPRPYAEEQQDLYWELLHHQGNARLRAAAAIGEEAGLRIGEICRLKLHHIDPVRQTIFVALPNKANRERYALYSDKCAKYIAEWLKERNAHCGHQYLFHNAGGGVSRNESLHKEFQRTLCKTYRGRVIHEVGFDSWSTHRLRHTMASNLVSGGADIATVMTAGGWNSYDSMSGYAQVDLARARKGYDEAMYKAREQRALPAIKKVITLAEFLSLKSE